VPFGASANRNNNNFNVNATFAPAGKNEGLVARRTSPPTGAKNARFSPYARSPPRADLDMQMPVLAYSSTLPASANAFAGGGVYSLF